MGVTIVDLIDLRRVIVDGPTTGVLRQQIPIKWLALTGLKCNIERGAREKTLKAALNAEDIFGKWEKTNWCKKMRGEEARKQLNDFDRFKVMLAKKKIAKAAKPVRKGGK